MVAAAEESVVVGIETKGMAKAWPVMARTASRGAMDVPEDDIQCLRE